MKKKVIFSAIIAAAVVYVLWSKVDDLTQPKSDTPSIAEHHSDEPVGATDEPSVEPSESPSIEPSADPSNSPSPEIPPKDDPEESSSDESEPPEDTAAFSSVLAENLPALTIKENEDGLAVITNASSIYVIANKKRNLPSDYIPDDLVIPNVKFSFSGDSPKKQLRKVAADALESLFDAAKDDDIELRAVSGYRSYASQKAIFDRNAKLKGEEEANKTSAHPGQSEHQTGLTMDVSSASVDYVLEETFGDSKEGKWLAKHAAEYGFIIRYLKGKEDITGYSYEPWHIRYVGKEVAIDIADRKVTLEQYFDAVAASVNK